MPFRQVAPLSGNGGPKNIFGVVVTMTFPMCTNYVMTLYEIVTFSMYINHVVKLSVFSNHVTFCGLHQHTNGNDGTQDCQKTLHFSAGSTKYDMEKLDC